LRYDPYRHAAELGLKVQWEDLKVNEPSGLDRETGTVTLPTRLDTVGARVRLAVILVYAEHPELNRTAHTQLIALRTAAQRLIRYSEYVEVTASIWDRKYQALALGVDEPTLAAYERFRYHV
jgi:hypothetical protein